MLVNIHSLRLDIATADMDGCWRVLNEIERKRAIRFRRQRHRSRWIIARAGMRKLLSGYCRTSPGQLEFSEEKFGKPVLKDERSSSAVHFNLSHSRDLAVLAVSRDKPVGVDIEYRRTISDMECVARRFFSNHEYNQWTRLSRQQQHAAFYRCWTRKEAIIKNSGMGLSAKLDTFDVSLNPNVPPAVLRGSHAGVAAGCWQLADPNIDDQYEVAVALCSGVPMVVDYQGVHG